MIKPVHPAALLLVLSASWLPAQAQNVYRCGESYSNTPCAGATVVATDDARSAAQRAQADAASRRDARAAQVMETERLKLEARPAPALVLAPVPAAEPTQAVSDKPSSKTTKAKKPEFFTAVTPKKRGDAAAKGKKKTVSV